RHYKSQDALYKIENVALRELDFVPLVIYRSLENNFVWARTLQEFLGFACSGKKRFVKVDERV
ncbi:DUF1653 domain-containing protein, partial [Patescibacteria group bacterium]|nr:DUF1653 domain-containing protein [Patescibacteria group bacterium]